MKLTKQYYAQLSPEEVIAFIQPHVEGTIMPGSVDIITRSDSPKSKGVDVQFMVEVPLKGESNP